MEITNHNLNRSWWQNLSFMGRLRFHLIGKTDEEDKFEQALDEIYTLKKTNELELNKKLQQSAGYTQILTYDGSFMMEGAILMGSSKFSMNVVFDTGSDWVTVTG